MKRLRTIVVEDVALARDALLALLTQRTDIALAGVAENLQDARTLLDRTRCDLLFLDVHLPDGHGVTLGEECLRRDRPPFIVYCTADPGFALQAIEQDAVDYLLKPVSAEAIARAIGRIGRRLSDTAPPSPIEIRNGRNVRFIMPSLIERVESAGHYQCLHAGGEVHLIRSSSTQLVEQLGPTFIRVHRAHLVRIDAIRQIETDRSGDGTIVLASGDTVRFSRGFRQNIEAALRAP